jgi:hypothetical protein
VIDTLLSMAQVKDPRQDLETPQNRRVHTEENEEEF